MFLDLKVNLGNFWGWKLPDAPYYFPDTLIFLLVNWIVQNSWWSIAIYSLVQASLVVFSLSWIYQLIGGKNKKIILVFISGIFLVFTKVYINLFDQLQGLITPYIYYLSSYIHFGTYISSLIALAISLKYLRTENKLYLIILVILTIITIASDLLFAIYFTIPFIVAMVIATKANILAPALHHRRLAYFIFAASLIAYIYNKYFDILAATTTVEIKLSSIFLSINTLINDLETIALTEKFFLVGVIIAPLIYLANNLISLNKKYHDNSTTTEKKANYKFEFIVCLYVWLAVILNLLAVIILGKYTTIPHARYLILVYYSPGLITIVSNSLWLENIKQINKIALAAAIAISIIASSSLITQRPISISAILSPPDYASCFNLNISQAGLAEYWQSKPLIAFSQRQIQIATINQAGEPSIWNSNRYWYTDSWLKPGNSPQFQFIFMKNLDQKAISSRYGQPDRIEACTDSEIWWYQDTTALYPQLMKDGL